MGGNASVNVVFEPSRMPLGVSLSTKLFMLGFVVQHLRVFTWGVDRRLPMKGRRSYCTRWSLKIGSPLRLIPANPTR